MLAQIQLELPMSHDRMTLARSLLGLLDLTSLGEDDSPARIESGPLHYSMSIGATMLDARDEGYEAAYARADEALYAAKHAGRNRVVLAPVAAGEPAMEVSVPEEVGNEDVASSRKEAAAAVSGATAMEEPCAATAGEAAAAGTTAQR